MKSTGLFGVNSGRVGGVVYSNYRGQQIVKSYQPQVKNPNSKGQIKQRAKFKLVSQLAAVFGTALKESFKPNNSKNTPRNEWVSQMLAKSVYSDGEASLPIEEIVLTNAQDGIISANVDNNNALSVTLPAYQWDISRVKARAFILAYSDGGKLTVFGSMDVSPLAEQVDPDFISLRGTIRDVPPGYANVRVVVFAYQASKRASIIYEDYEIEGQEATLSDIVNVMGVSSIDFSRSLNIPVHRNV